METNHNPYAIYELCKNHMHAYVMAELTDESRFDGIVTGLDQDYVYFAVPVEHDPHSYDEWRNGVNQKRRFNRVLVPISALESLHGLPWY